MKVTWYGESGFCIEAEGKRLLIDPYFSDALGKKREDRHRLVPVSEEWLTASYDYLLFTHCHIDHTDPETVETLLAANPHLILAGPRSSLQLLPFAPLWAELREGAEARFGPFRVTALPAIHSDRFALGYRVEVEGKTLYFSGDTALLSGLQERVPQKPDAAFLCFNAGVGKNMDEKDAVRLALVIRPGIVIPFHYGILPGGVEPGRFCQLLTEAGVPWYLPGYGETFELTDLLNAKKRG